MSTINKNYKDVPIDSVRPHPRNPRQGDVGAIHESITQSGFYGAIVVQESTGYILAGNHRWMAAREAGMQTIPAIIVDVDDDRAKRILLADNRTNDLASYDDGALVELLRELEVQTGSLAATGYTTDDLDDLIQQMGDAFFAEEAAREEIRSMSDIPDELEGAFELKTEMIFPSNEPYGIPPLREDRLFRVPEDIRTWPGDDLTDDSFTGCYLWVYSSSLSRLPFERAILAFYTDDVKFERVWLDPSGMATRLLNAGVLATVAPNYSLWYDDPLAAQIWNTYRSRWLARYFQEAGISVVPDINFSGKESYEFCFAGIPKGAPTVAFQAQTVDKNDPDNHERLKEGVAEALSVLEPQSLLVYGGKLGRSLVEEVVPESLPTIYLPSYMDMRREKLREKKERMKR